MAEIATTCPFCGCGCGLYLHVAEGRISGVAPSRRHPVSEGRLCLKGWHAHELMDNPARLSRPLLRTDGELRPASWEEALSAVAKGLQAALAAGGPQAVGVLGSARATNEDNYVLARFARGVLGTPNLDCTHRTGSLPTSGDLAAVSASDLCVLVGNDPNEEHPAVSARIYRNRPQGAKLIVIATRRHALARLADVYLPARPGGEAEVLRALLKALLAAHRTGEMTALAESVADATAESAGVPAADLEQAAQLLGAAKRTSVLYASSLSTRPHAATVRAALADLAAVGSEQAGRTVTLLELLERNNLRGCLDMGICPDRLPGRAELSDEAVAAALGRAWGGSVSRERGLTAWDMPQAVKALYVLGDDPSGALPESKWALPPFLVVQDLFLGPLAKRANVVLPAAAFGEREGTYTNQEGRVQRVRKAVEPPGEAREDWQILVEVSARLGAKLAYQSAEQIFAEIASAVPGYGGLSYASLAPAGGVRPSADGPRFAWQSRLEPLPANGAGPKANGEFPFLLLADATLGPWDQETTITSTLTIGVEFTLSGRDYPTGMLCLHPEDAKQLGVRPGRTVTVRSARREVTARVAINDEVPPKIAIVPYWQAVSLDLMEAVASQETGRPTLAPTPVAIVPA